MFPFWTTVLEPLLQAADARRLLEIGALRGENTELLLGALAEDAELHVIDPVPLFDPEDHRRRFGPRYVFHQALSLEVLDDLPPFDVALIDGDHNWYTVFHELEALARTSQAAGRSLPVCVLHDVGWPYGRRDLYYDPTNIPDEHRQPWKRRGMRMGRSELVFAGGLNAGLANAEHEGGPRNGVMTAVDDFVAGHDRPLRQVVIPVYFGLAILVEEEVLERTPALAAFLDRLESAEGRGELLEMGERIRLEGVVWHHSVEEYRERKLGVAERRYFDLLKSALVNEHYLEHEARLAHLLECVETGKPLDRGILADPARQAHGPWLRLAAARRAGSARDPEADPAGFFPWAASGRVRLDRLHSALDEVRDARVPGDLVDVHPGRGGTSVLMRTYLDIHQMNGPRVWLADVFGVDEAGTGDPRPAGLNTVRDGLERFDALDDRVRFLQGPLPDALDGAELETIALLRVGGDDPETVTTALRSLYGRVAEGGRVFVDTRSVHVVDAVETLLDSAGASEVRRRLDLTGLEWTKTDEVDLGVVATRHEPPARPLLLSSDRTGRVDLSVVVVFYNMAREAERTLHSLSRAYQQDLDDVDYEVLVADNGSDPDQALDARFVAGFGPEFRLVELGDAVSPSPTTALNRAMAESRGDVIALMIDGAHVLTPRVLHMGLLGTSTYERSVVLTQQWYVGPGQQHDAMLAGYDQATEDRLFELIDWPSDGYRLFEIGSFIGDRDWFDGMPESNCLFVPRWLLEQVGGFDDSFSRPGGSMANLDLYERLAATPDLTPVTVLGEGSFHQIHGGTTTNNGDIDARGAELTAYREEYEALRGRVFGGHGKPIHYLGSLYGPAKRTKARRMTSATLFGGAQQGGPDGRPLEPSLIPDEVRTGFVDAYWRSYEWRDATWLGRRHQKSPIDLFTYQEIVHEVRPDWIVDVGTGGGGRALYLASVCDLLGRGRVVSVGEPSDAVLRDHPRVDWVVGDPAAPEVVSRVRALVGGGSALVVMSLAAKRAALARFEAYQSLVPVGSYVVFEETIVNGNPVWPGFGPGPAEAVRTIIRNTSDFHVDQSREHYAATFNVGGYLKRHR